MASPWLSIPLEDYEAHMESSPVQRAATLRAGRDRGEIEIAVGTHIAMRPPHKTGRAAFPHPASTSGV
jgi:hypothetical protein